MSPGPDGCAPEHERRYRSIAFGLCAESDWPLPGARPVTDESAQPKRMTRIRLAAPAAFAGVWDTPAERVHELRDSGGTARFTVSRGDESYRFSVHGYGRYLVARDGGCIECEGGMTSVERRERFVLCHGLPVAAMLQGFELLHASAIAGREGAAAFAGASGRGKSTITSWLVVNGAEFVTDDVLVVAPGPGGVMVQPGPPFMAIRPEDARTLVDTDGRLGTRRGTTDKVHFSPTPRKGALPLRLLYHLEVGDEVAITPLTGSHVRSSLGLAYVPYLMGRERLSRYLGIAQLLSTDVAHFRLRAPRGLVGPVVECVEQHLRAQGI